ncbi:MAG: Mut7-C RNAse domain-containing protein [Candidatus Micrarchaeota archaeon]|nr:Mut7-C RNAse domain-containing protein [Candidatus Micrarchaeota archaeon]
MFVADVMLKKLARWLRIMGFPVIYPENQDDSHILALAVKTNFPLLTMDVELAKRAAYKKHLVFLVPNGTAEMQASAVIRHFKLKPKPLVSSTLCPKCNATLVRVPKSSVKGLVYPKVYSSHRIFWKCPDCKKLYWMGSHWEKIKKRVGIIKRMARARIR